MKKLKAVLPCCFFILFAALLYAEEDIPPEETLPPAENGASSDKSPSLDRQQIELEIKTSSLPELAAWCRILGLSEGGTRADIARRLREYFKLPEPKTDADDKRKVITIETAQATEYFRIDVIDEDYARLSGEVRLSLKDNDAVHKIRANEILFNRTRNIISARGEVEYIKEQGDTTDIFRGKNITVYMDDWSSIFLDGDSEKKLESDGTTYRFSGAVIMRTPEEVTILSNAQISNANNAEALWSISATKLWLLPGSDFAIFNGILKVGEIPVLYIPFFYYPADEVIFHPVLGYRSREGSFAQTTYYILGRPKANTAEASSISRILGNSNDMEKRREGIFLRSTGKKSKDPNVTSLKAFLDYYSNLGGYFGLDLATPKLGVLNALDLSLGIGVTRTVTETGGNYSPFSPNDGESDWNKSNLFSQEAPFRYRFKTQSSITGKYGNLSWNLPYYSDPFMDKDFLSRSEDMDWFNMIQKGAAMEDEIKSQNEVQSYQWQLTGSLRPSFPKLAPYISNMSISSYSMTLAFNVLTDKKLTDASKDSPNRFFFAPDRATLYSISSSVSGSPLKIGGGSSPTASTPVQETEDPLKDIGIPISPWVKEDSAPSGKSPDEILVPPVLSQRFEGPRVGNARFNIDYSLSPTSSSELQFRSGYDNWKSYDEVDWSEVQSILGSMSGSGSINLTLNHSENLFSSTFSFSGSGTYRDYWYLNEEAEAYTTSGNKDDTKINNARRQQYSQTNYSTNYSYNGSMRPLYRDPVFGQSNLQYGFRGNMVRSKFTGTGDDPQWEPQWGTWKKEEKDVLGLTSHQFSTNISASIMEKQQNITLSADLPPLDASISTNASFRVWIYDTTARIQVKNPAEEDKRKIEPFYWNGTFKFEKIGSLTHYIVLDDMPDKNEITTITSTLTLWNFKTSFSAVRMRRYEFKPDNPANPTLGGKWEQIDEKVEEPSLVPRDLSFSYSRSFSNIEPVKNRLRFSTNFNTGLNFDLQRYTNSNFSFTLGFNLGITGFLDLNLSTTSANAVVFRYFKDVPGMEEYTKMYPEGEQNNLFTDLFDSFNFGDDAKRRRSGFKMKSFSLSANHHLGDWKATLGITMSPYLPQGSTQYDFNTDFSFLVQWVPISEIKSDIKYEKRTDTWTVK